MDQAKYQQNQYYDQNQYQQNNGYQNYDQPQQYQSTKSDQNIYSDQNYGEQKLLDDGGLNMSEDGGLLGNSRMGFVRKVFLIVLAQLAITASLCAISITNTSYLIYQYNNWWVMLITFMIAIFVEVALLCSRNLARKVPINYILLFIFTAAFSYSISYTCGLAGCYTVYQWPYSYVVCDLENSADIVIEAAGITAGMVLGLTVMAFIVKDIKFWVSLLFVVIFTYMFYGLFYWWMNPNAAYMFYCSMGIIIFGIYIIIDIIMIVGGKRFEISYDDYIFAALILYIDIIRLFLYILAMLGRK